MIFEWLRQENRTSEKTKVYGYTRSWSKIGSAVSVVIAAALVFYTGRYSYIFWFSIPPYLVNIVNFLGYPKYLDGTPSTEISLRQTVLTLWDTLKESVHDRPLRRLFLESMGFEGTFKVTKDYIQPILKQAAINLPVLLWLSDDKRSAILVGIVYVILYLLSTVASRNAHHVSDRLKSEEGTILTLWKADLAIFLILIPAMWFRVNFLSISLFVLLFILQNLWRPVQITRFDTHSDSGKGATILSIESQSKSLFTMLMAPVLGFAVDHLGFWPIGVLGTLIAATAILTAPPQSSSSNAVA
jgi:MFS family permease